ncbi:MAG: hypothetical protein AAF567_09040 [Actinomycetota bacterium]
MMDVPAPPERPPASVRQQVMRLVIGVPLLALALALIMFGVVLVFRLLA